jgi:uncharacterized FlaG/YvyC family protein
MDITIASGRPPSAQPPIGTAIAEQAPAAEPSTRDVAGAPKVEEPKLLPKLTAVARLDNRTELDVDRPTGLVVGRLVDWETGKVVEQVPSEEAVRILEKARRMIGAILDKTA